MGCFPKLRALLIAWLVLFLGGCDNQFENPVVSTGQGSASNAQVSRVFGRVVLRPFIAVEPNFRADVVSNREQLEAEELQVSEDGSIILYPESPAGGYRVSAGEENVIAGFDGVFSLSTPVSEEGRILHPTDERAPALFDPSRLSDDPENPATIVVLHPFMGPCGMNIPREEFCTVDSPQDLVGPILAKAVPTAITTGPRGTYPQPIRNSVCEDKNGILSGITRNKYLAYVGSTCDGYIKVGCCPNENPFSDIEYDILQASPGFNIIEAIRAGNLNVQLSPAVLPAGLGAPDLSCVDNHKGRVCQQLLPGDLSLDTGKNIAEAFEIEVVDVLPGTSYGFAVHNNGCFGNTEIVPLARFINGTLTGIGLKPGGATIPITPALIEAATQSTALAPFTNNLPPAGLLTIGQTLEHFNPTSPLPTYVTDRFLNYSVPPGAVPGQVDAFLFLTDNSPVFLVFRVVGSGGDGTGIAPPAQATTVSPPSLSFTHCVGVTECPQSISPAVTVTNNGSAQVEVVPEFDSDAALAVLPVRRTLMPGESVDFTLEFDCTRTESYNTTARFVITDLFGQSNTKTVNVVAIIEHEVLVLDFQHGPFSPGTEIRMSRVTGGTRAGVEGGCAFPHLHGAPVAIDGIHVKTVDPNPPGCGHGHITKSEGGKAP